MVYFKVGIEPNSLALVAVMVFMVVVMVFKLEPVEATVAFVLLL